MPEPSRFLQIHYLTAFPGSLLNRDDAGMAKRLPFGGTSRIRVSSQCLKRHWRTAEGERSLRSLGMDMSVRSRAIFEKEVFNPLVAEGADRDALRVVVQALQRQLLGSAGEAPAADADEEAKPVPRGKKVASPEKEESGESDESLRTSQLIVLGRPEIDYIKQMARQLLKEVKDVAGRTLKATVAKGAERYVKDHADNLRRMTSGLDAAIFGRFVTSDQLARRDAAVHVAHAFTVHAEEVEADYFSAVDDLLAAEQQRGSGHIGEAELTSGLFYGYVVVDVPLLVSNLEGCAPAAWTEADRSLAARVAENLIHLIATVSPGAKRGSTAPYAYADLILLETGRRMPRTLANAFLRAVDVGPSGDVRAAAIEALGRHLTAFDRMYGSKEDRRVATLMSAPGLPAEDAGTLDAAAAWAAKQIRAA